MGTTPQAVSAALRRGGMLPVPRHRRDGISVSRSPLGAAVIASVIDSSRRERELSAEAELILNEAGYTSRRVDGNPTIFYVSKESA